MDPVTHAGLSVKRWGGQINDYYPIHHFIDSTKELCSDNRHRLLHTLWGVRRVVIPIFGPTITNSEGKPVPVKEICEKDHILPDYQNRFIPTLSDFVQALDFGDDHSWKTQLETFHGKHVSNARLSRLLLSPLSLTGRLESLLITHNSWFLNEIAPQVLNTPPQLTEIDLTPAYLFEHMHFKLWMDNGTALPPSARGGSHEP
ncbi:MAG: hypothetical protein AAF633_10645 [Chloroflexota bacterium]